MSKKCLSTAPRDGSHLWVKQAGENAIAGEARWVPELAGFAVLKYGESVWAVVRDGWWWPLPCDSD